MAERVAKAEIRKAEKLLVPCLDLFLSFLLLANKWLKSIMSIKSVMLHDHCIALNAFFSACTSVDFGCFQQAVHNIK